MAETGTAMIALNGAGREANSARADLLARVIDAFQQATYVFAAARLKLPQNLRFKPGSDLRADFSLQIFPAVKGSLAVPIALAPNEDMILPELDFRPQILDDIQYGLAAIKAGDRTRLQELLPDSVLRTRFLREASRAIPRKGESWELKYRNGHVDWVTLDQSAQRTLDGLIAGPDTIEQSLTITGELTRIDFRDRALWLRYPPNGREIKCSYTIDIEESILDSRNEPIQVRGQFILDDDGYPKSLTDVYRVEPVNLEPMRLTEIRSQRDSFVISPPLVVRPSLSEDQQCYEAVDEDLGIHAYGSDRDELMSEIYTQVGILWHELVETHDRLTAGAQLIAVALRNRIKKVS